jgi:signal transduction histidine kinase
LRSPLNSILGYAQLLEKDDSLADSQHKKVKVIRRSGDHLADLIEGLLDISRIEAGYIEFRRDEVVLQSFIDELIEMFQQQAQAKGIEFTYVQGSPLPNVVYADQRHLRQILINLLSNAVKFTQKGQVSLSVRYRNQVAEFVIEDTGMGIKENDKAKIFEPFERIYNGGYPQPNGTGLGLTISQLLAELMGGDIMLESEYKVGSTFKLALMLPSVTNPKVRVELAKRIESFIGPVWWSTTMSLIVNS